MDTYKNNLKRSTMYIYKLMLKSNITHSPDIILLYNLTEWLGNQNCNYPEGV